MSRSAQDGSSAPRGGKRRWRFFDGKLRSQVGLWGVTLALFSGLAGCMGPVAKAPYAGRLGSGQAGSLLGPFEGQVLDQSTASPLGSALVVGTWAFQQTGGIAAPESSYTVTAITGGDGAYVLPSLPAGRQFAGLLRRFTLVVYKAGFLGYRSDLRFDDRSPRRDFVQRGNVVRLERFPQDESHVRHLVFLGGGPALRGAAQAEIISASLELQETAPQLAREQEAPAAGTLGPAGTTDKPGASGTPPAPVVAPSKEGT